MSLPSINLNDYLETDINDSQSKYLKDFTSLSLSKKKVLTLFHKAAKQIPAYKDFLQKNKINPKNIKNIADFEKVPFTDKKNYIDKYKLTDLTWNQNTKNDFLITSSSGTTGKPYYWPCDFEEIYNGALIHEIIYKNCFQVDKKNTLLIICFGMGSWIAGMYTFLSSQMIALKKYPLTIITPGFNKDEAISILLNLAPNFSQTLIAGIPTFVKDLVDQYSKKTTIGKKVPIKLLLAGEGFSEEWRKYMLLKLYSQKDTDIINILGSADAAIMGFETKESILIRKLALKNSLFRQELYKNERIPSVESYFPSHRFYQIYNNELLLSATRALPLIRYNIHDQGGIHSVYCLNKKMRKYFPNLDQSISLPQIYIWGRGKFSATIYAANIYPENIKDVLIQKEIYNLVTGRFFIETKYNTQQNHYLHLDVELSHGVKSNIKITNTLLNIFIATVRKTNSEYNQVYKEYKQKAVPKIILHEYGQSQLFPLNQTKKTS